MVHRSWSTTHMENRERPISVRPRKGSELDRVWQECQNETAKIREILHSWAEKSKQNKS